MFRAERPIVDRSSSKVVKMMVSSEGIKVAIVGSTDSKNRLEMQVRKLVPVLCPDFVVTLGPYVP
jgi:hypothetical protein